MLSKLKIAVVSLSVALMSACGGGGGGGNPYAGLLLISPSNYVGVATDSIYGANGASDATSLGTNLVGAEISQSSSFGLKRIAVLSANTLLKNGAAFTSPTVVGAVMEESSACSGGGSLSISVNDADNNDSLSVGDSLRGTFNNCVENGLRINGSLSMSVNSYSGNLANSGSLSLTMEFNNLSGGNESINGSIILVMNQTTSTNGSVSLTMPSVTLNTNGNTFTYTDFNMTTTLNGLSSTLTMGGNVSSSKYGGSVDITTPTRITIDSSDRVTGTILMAGKNGTKVRIIGQGTTNIRIEADTTGNGTYDTNTTVNLANLGL